MISDLKAITMQKQYQYYYFCIMAQTIFEYFKKELDDAIILVRINPNSYEGIELIVLKNNQVKKTDRLFNKSIYEDLEYDGFLKGNTLEINLHLQGISEHK